ncbi:MAG: NAD-glutamate dehydrogenase, partial [Myxococcales bacterium]|nr:NAD-glutamate dehydrogenase [Myxococcales bacterium]
FDPDLEGDRDAAMAHAADEVDRELRYILSHDEDLVFATLRELMRATIRTNFYRTDRPFHYLSFKLDCSQVPSMGANRPMFEIYVHHREVEGVHLRFGKVARGGLRWSDRDDYRTEVLGLVTTQLVKNVVIVPTGSKGGFYLKHPSPDPRVRRQEADHHYKTFIRGLLDVTDNNVDGQVVTPPRVVRHDEQDPYLVVAADKGTAHLSDTANGISREYGFWLDDAFASGGSVGYDHKGVGITARGAWVLVRRHFAEMGVDPYNEPFTCTGVGDMGGDVFGNGLIESDKTRLLAAFNHLHIFLDPDPDPARSYTERKRLFDAVGGWDQYDLSTISEGGGVFDRRAKSIPLSPPCRKMLGIDAEEADPNEVIHAILKMEVDLLWNGGIGTYVKASNETHADADDRSNDAVRIDATELRARVVGEGGNLGMTQRARIEADRCGVRLNTDAIDNSGGVDLSDHEVNLKILLSRPVERGDLSNPDRNALLEQLTDEVAGLVLANNDAHGRQLSRDRIRSKANIFAFGRAIAFVERHFPVTRKQLRLPTDAELANRAESGVGLTRPELAVLSAWVKMFVYRELLTGSPKSIPGYDKLLFEYFPAAVREPYADDIRNHMLADEIAMTVATTSIIADAGAAFFPMAMETTGASVAAIATAYLKAQEIARAREVRSTLEELRTSVSLEALYTSWVRVDAGAQHVAGYWLSAHGRVPTDEELTTMREAAHQVYQLQASEVARRNASLLAELRDADIPDEVAHLILQAQYLNVALMIWAEARRTGTDFPKMVVHHLAVARASGVQRVLEDLGARPAGGRWDPIALSILHNRFHQLLRQLVARTPMEAGASVDAVEARLRKGFLQDVRDQVDAMIGSDEVASVATLIVLEERIASAITRLA